MNLSTLKREIVYLVEDELKKRNMMSYDGYQDDIRTLMLFFLDQRVDYEKIPGMVVDMFLNPPEVYFIKMTGEYDTYKLRATGLHEQAIRAYSFRYLEAHPEDDTFKIIFQNGTSNEMMKALYDRGITTVRMFHNAITKESYVVTTPISENASKVKETYEKMKHKFSDIKNGNVKFETCSIETFDYDFTNDVRNNHKK